MANQGCPNEGADRRFLGVVICWLQHHLSFTGSPPRLHEHGLWAFTLRPPYLVVNWLTKYGWRMLRIGWRYDKYAKPPQYIGPSAAFKKVKEPLFYY